MTTSNVFIINRSASFEEQTNAVRGLLLLANDGVRRMDAGYTPDVADTICNINAAIGDWLEHNLSDESQRRSVRSRPALRVAAE